MSENCDVVDLDLLDLFIDERNHAWEGHTVAAICTCPISAYALKELMSDDDNRIILKLSHRKARFSFGLRVVGIVLRRPHGHLMRQQQL